MTVTLRPETEADEALLLALYGASREYELSLVAWSAEQKAIFIKAQFAAQRNHYRTHYAEAQFDIILFAEQPVGRLYVYRGKSEIRIVDIAILPAYRGRGIGKPLIQSLLNEAQASGKHIRIHVEVFNPSLQLFERLGFKPVENDGINVLMEWTPVAL
ncbi:MAG: GNAT family N-acetyltransferase [Acidobacteriota bacterium]